MQFVDDRTDDQKKTHRFLVTATDKFMSGWGEAKGGKSKCAWACLPEHVDHVERWVRARPEMKYVNVTTNTKWRGYPAAHVHVYVVDEGHPALGYQS